MAEHHPMDRLHQHLDKVALHGGRIKNAADTAAAAVQAQQAAERPDTGRETLRADGS